MAERSDPPQGIVSALEHLGQRIPALADMNGGYVPDNLKVIHRIARRALGLSGSHD